MSGVLRHLSPRSVVMLLLLSVCAGCSRSGPGAPVAGAGPTTGAMPSSPSAKKPTGPISVQVAVAAATPYTPAIELGATMAARETVTLATEVAGELQRLDVDLGDRILAGQVLGDVARDELSWAAEKAEAEASLAEVNLKRIEALVASQSATHQELDRSRADAIRTRAESRLAAKRLADTTLLSPITGYVAQRFASPGDYLSVGKPVLSIASIDPLRLRVEVPEQYVGTVKEGTPVTLEVAGMEPIKAAVRRISPIVSTTTRTFAVEADVPNPGGKLKAGMYARALLQPGERRDVAMVPETALMVTAGNAQVFEVVNGAVRAHPVTILARVGMSLQLEGIDPGVPIVIRGVQRLYDGAPVVIGTGEDVSPATEGEGLAMPPAPPALSAPASSEKSGVPANGAPANGAPANRAPANGVPTNGAPAGVPAAPAGGASPSGARMPTSSGERLAGGKEVRPKQPPKSVPANVQHSVSPAPQKGGTP